MKVRNVRMYTEKEIEGMSKAECYTRLLRMKAFNLNTLMMWDQNHGELFAQLKLYNFLDEHGYIKK